MISIQVSGNYKKTKKFLEKSQRMSINAILNKYGRLGVEALSSATPKDTGKTAASWSYEIKKDRKGPSIIWKNSNRNNGVSIALILQYGHGTGNGGYVQGRDYINPALRPIFDELSEAAWKEVNAE